MQCKNAMSECSLFKCLHPSSRPYREAEELVPGALELWLFRPARLSWYEFCSIFCGRQRLTQARSGDVENNSLRCNQAADWNVEWERRLP